MQALAGLRVLDLTRLLPGPYGSLFLADFGAEVIKVEEPRQGDYEREFPPPVPASGIGYRYYMLNRNKKSVALNLKDPRGREAFHRLAQTADVVIEGFRPGVVKRLGIDYETLRPLNPRLIYCSLSGYGQGGPYEQLAGHDLNYIAFAGLLALHRDAEGRPVVPGVQIADLGGGGMLAAIGILLALAARERTGRGQYVDISMLDGAVSWLYAGAHWWYGAGVRPHESPWRTAGTFPCYAIYETKDGKWFTIGAFEEHFWANLCDTLGVPEYIAHQYDVAKRDEIFARLRAIFRTKTRDEWFAQLKDIDICVAPMLEIDEVERDPQVQYRQLIQRVQQPGVGEIAHIGIPVKLSDTPGAIYAPAPEHGEHTAELLATVGYSTADIADLRRDGVIR
jgi:crotonobetainyl-CoA:carnitine CoA-transferase CaiB-like acyl-CoA transferase